MGSVPALEGAPQAQRTLVLLTRQFPRLPALPGHTWVQPSRPIPVRTWDYTNETALQDAYELGQEDGAAFFSSLMVPA